jgi:lipopolysaccharide transport system permease protein
MRESIVCETLNEKARAEEGRTVAAEERVVSKIVTVIEPKPGWQIVNWREMMEYRDLFLFWVWRDIKGRYAQSVLGIGWAIVQPVFTMLVFTVVFGKLAKIGSDGIPYPIFSLAGLVPWTYFSNCINMSAGILIQHNNMISKVYFPRLILPVSSVLGKLLDFAIAMTILIGFMVAYRVTPSVWIGFLPVLILIMMLSATGVSLWLSAMAVQYRDIRYGMQFGVQLLMYAAPVVYPASYVPEQYRLLYAVNPMVGVIEGFRSCLLGTTEMPWDFIAVGAITAVVLTVTGALFFKRTERVFADVA